MQIDSVAKTRESWIPLEKALGQAQCKDFMWMGSTGTVQQYKHIDTRRYLFIDAISGAFYDNHRRAISKEHAMSSVLS